MLPKKNMSKTMKILQASTHTKFSQNYLANGYIQHVIELIRQPEPVIVIKVVKSKTLQKFYNIRRLQEEGSPCRSTIFIGVMRETPYLTAIDIHCENFTSWLVMVRIRDRLL